MKNKSSPVDIRTLSSLLKRINIDIEGPLQGRENRSDIIVVLRITFSVTSLNKMLKEQSLVRRDYPTIELRIRRDSVVRGSRLLRQKLK